VLRDLSSTNPRTGSRQWVPHPGPLIVIDAAAMESPRKRAKW